MKKSIFLLFCVIMAFPTLAYSTEKEKMVLVKGFAYPPYHLTTEKGQEGLFIEIIEAAASMLNMDIAYKLNPWSKCLSMMKRGEADAMMPLFKTEERAEFMYFYDDNILAYENNSFVILKEKEKDIKYTGDLQEMKPYRIGIMQDYSYGEAFDGADFLLKVKFRSDIEGILLRKLIEKKVHVIIGDPLVINYIALKTGVLDKITSLNPPVLNEPLYIAFSKPRSRKDLAEDFANALKKFKATKEYKEIVHKYGLE